MLTCERLASHRRCSCIEMSKRKKVKKVKVCPDCKGSTYAPYVGGDDDTDRCETCNGTGRVTIRRVSE